MSSFNILFKSLRFTKRDRNIKSSNQSNKLSTSNLWTVVPITHATIRIKRDLRLRHPRLFTLLNANKNMPRKMTSATTRQARVHFRAVKAPSTIPDRLTIYCLEEFLIVRTYRRGRWSRALGAVAIRKRCGVVTSTVTVDADGISSGAVTSAATATKQSVEVLGHVLLFVISGHPAQTPLLVHAHLHVSSSDLAIVTRQ